MTNDASTPLTVAVLGLGQLATSLLQGWQKAGVLGTSLNVWGVANSTATAQKTHAQFGFPCFSVEGGLAPLKAECGLAGRTQETSSDLAGRTFKQSCETTDVFLLAVKPFQVLPVLYSLKGKGAFVKGQPVLSLAAGVQLATMEAELGASQPLARVMGNTLWQEGQGVALWAANAAFTQKHQPEVLLHRLFAPVGLCLPTEEKHFDALTALVGSGPAFIFTLMEAFIDGAVQTGLPRGLAVSLVPALFEGSAALLASSGKHPAQLRDQITTPAGTTMAGLLALEEGAVRYSVVKALEAATQKAQAFAQLP